MSSSNEQFFFAKYIGGVIIGVAVFILMGLGFLAANFIP
jgi:hypothetical protein